MAGSSAVPQTDRLDGIAFRDIQVDSRCGSGVPLLGNIGVHRRPESRCDAGTSLRANSVTVADPSDADRTDARTGAHSWVGAACLRCPHTPADVASTFPPPLW